jgi:hypothetical protein
MASSLEEGDTIAVVNANARVAELISEKIISQGRFRVRLIGNNAQVRDPSTAWSYKTVILSPKYYALLTFLGNDAQSESRPWSCAL